MPQAAHRSRTRPEEPEGGSPPAPPSPRDWLPRRCARASRQGLRPRTPKTRNQRDTIETRSARDNFPRCSAPTGPALSVTSYAAVHKLPKGIDLPYSLFPVAEKPLEKGWVRLWFCVRIMAPLLNCSRFRVRRNWNRFRSATPRSDALRRPAFLRDCSHLRSRKCAGDAVAVARLDRPRGPRSERSERGGLSRSEAKGAEGALQCHAYSMTFRRAVGEPSPRRRSRKPRQGRSPRAEGEGMGDSGEGATKEHPVPPSQAEARQPGRTPPGGVPDLTEGKS